MDEETIDVQIASNNREILREGLMIFKAAVPVLAVWLTNDR